MPVKPKVVFRITDVPLIESPDRMNRDSVMVTDSTCGATQFSAGLFFVRPHGHNHLDKHAGQEELYYIFKGRGLVMIDDEPHEIRAGDVVMIPEGSKHQVVNNSDEELGLFWAIPTTWSNLKPVIEHLATWQVVEPDSAWSA